MDSRFNLILSFVALKNNVKRYQDVYANYGFEYFKLTPVRDKHNEGYRP